MLQTGYEDIAPPWWYIENNKTRHASHPGHKYDKCVLGHRRPRHQYVPAANKCHKQATPYVQYTRHGDEEQVCRTISRCRDV